MPANFPKTWAANNPLVAWHESLTKAIARDLGQIIQEFSVTSDVWPPLRVVQVTNQNGDRFLLTSGMALRCQPMVERELINFTDHQRLELAVAIPADVSGGRIEAMAAWLAGLARYPWHHETCFLPTQKLTTIAPYDATPTAMTGAKIEWTLTAEPQVASLENRTVLALPNYRQQNVNVVWLTK